MARVTRMKRSFGRLVAFLGYLSSLVFAFIIYAIFWEGFIQYIPDLATPESTITEMGWLGMVAVAYLGIQVGAVAVRNVSGVWGDLLDLMLSVVPAFVLVVGVYTHYGTLDPYQIWLSRLFGLALIVDIIFVTRLTFELLLRANDFVNRD